MFRTLVFFILMWTTLLLSIPLLLVLSLPKSLLPENCQRRFTAFITRNWARLTLFIAGIRLSVKGKENIPGYREFAIVANHQGNMDVPSLITLFPYPVSFVTKMELMKIPIIRSWIRILRCPVINRSRSPEAREIIQLHLQNGLKFPLIIFPEGTRSQGHRIRPFRTGGLEIIKNSGYPVLPVTICGSWHSWEEKRRIHPAVIKLTIHPIMEPSIYQNMKTESFVEELHKTIGNK
jgi:1-acyl-sn-glycerol-3-phosphate acyltransferase